VGGGVFLRRRENVFGNRIEDTWVFSENLNVEDFLWVREAEVFKSRVETSIFGSKIWDAERGGDLRVPAHNQQCSHHLAYLVGDRKEPDRRFLAIARPTPAPVNTTTFFAFFNRCAASSKVFHCGNLTRFCSSLAMQMLNSV
jgi:hypothetical protein